MKSRRNFILHPSYFILFLALGLRLALAVAALVATGSVSAFHTLDTGSYIEAARSLASGQGFSIGGSPEIVRTPGYPLMLAIGAALGNLEVVGVALQIAVSVFTVYLVYKTGLLIFERREIASLCAFLYAVEPLSILYTSKILTETLFAATVVLFLYYVARYFKERSLLHLAASGLSLAAAAYVRPIIIYFPLLAATILLVWSLMRERRRVVSLVAVGLFLLLSLGPVGLWQLRNQSVADYHGFSAISDINWYFYQGASVLAAQRGVPYYVVQEELGYGDREIYFENHPEQRAWSQGAVYEYMGREGRRTVFADLPGYLEVHAKGLVKTLINPGGVEYLKTLNLYQEEGGEFGVAVNAGLRETLSYLLSENPLLLTVNVLLGLMLGAYVLLALVGVVSRRRFDAASLMVVALGLYLLLVSGGPQSLSRFRHPIMPVLCLLAGYGLYVVANRVRERGWLRSVLAPIGARPSANAGD